MGETTYIPVEVSNEPPIHPSLPQRPAFNLAPTLKEKESTTSGGGGQALPQEGITLATNHDVVANRRAIRLANMNAADMLRAELAGRASLNPSAPAPSANGMALPKIDDPIVVPYVKPTESDVPLEPPPIQLPSAGPVTGFSDYANLDVLPGLGGPLATGWGMPANERGIGAPSALSPPLQPPLSHIGENQTPRETSTSDTAPPDLAPATGLEDAPKEERAEEEEEDDDAIAERDDGESMDTDESVNGGPESSGANGIGTTLTDATLLTGVKRKHEDVEPEEGFAIEEDDEEAPDAAGAVAPRKVNPDGTVEQEDTVR